MKTYQEKNTKARADYEELVIPENQSGTDREVLSPSGRFKLLIRSYAKKGSWSITRGMVTRVSDDADICDIVRNYGFSHSWVTKGDHEYLITGRSYMSQTIVNLDTGVEMEPPNYHYEGMAFCWVQASLMDDGKTLLVDGCHWACPYEFRFYDFSDPETKGWPELLVVPLEEWEKHKDNLYDAEGQLLCKQEWLSADEVAPVYNEDGTITVVETEKVFLPTRQRENEITAEELDAIDDADYDNEDNWGPETQVCMILERRGDLMVILDTWKSPRHLKWEADQKAYQEKQTADFKHWRETDETLALLKSILENHPTLEPLTKLGMTGSSGKARSEGEKNMWFFHPEIKSKTPQEQWAYDEDEEDPCWHDPRVAYLKWGTIAGDTVIAEFHSVTREHGTRIIRTETFPKTEEGICTALQQLQQHLDEA